MGNELSGPAKKAASGALRRSGDPLNVLGYPVVHEKLFLPPSGKPHRFTICRCWMSLGFPLCDNTHQRLQKVGVNVGPVMLEIKSAPTNVGANYFGHGASAGPTNLGAGGDRLAAAAGGLFAAGLAGAAHLSGVV
mmetsp:Transcript_20439/g.70792  ORF Transcript_20439/g.70792 Transcript_20439/m.70792 type:complete len:135 (-) Transcript_20439:171-575(-)